MDQLERSGSPNDDNATIYISSEIDQNEHENYVITLRSVDLQVLGVSTECYNEVFPFVCLYLFPLSTCGQDDKKYQAVIRPSPQSCKLLRDDVCKDLWTTLTSSKPVASLLPDCEGLPKPRWNLLKTCKGTNISVLRSVATLSGILCLIIGMNKFLISHHYYVHVENLTIDDDSTAELNCSQDFISFNLSKHGGTICAPECQRWSPFTPREVKITDILVVLSAALALVLGSAVLILGCIRCKKM